MLLRIKCILFVLSMFWIPAFKAQEVSGLVGRNRKAKSAKKAKKAKKNALGGCPEVPENGCSICGEGLCVGNPGALFDYPRSTLGVKKIPCGEVEREGYEGGIDPIECGSLPYLVQGDCECGTGSTDPDEWA